MSFSFPDFAKIPLPQAVKDSLPNPERLVDAATDKVNSISQQVSDLKNAGITPPLDAFKFSRDGIASAAGKITSNIPGLNGLPGAQEFAALGADKVKSLTNLQNSINPSSSDVDKLKNKDAPSGNLITQSERLFTVRARSSAYPDKQGGNRGTRARIRLLTTDLEKSRSSRSTTNLNTSFGDSDLNTTFNRLTEQNPGAGYDSFLLTGVQVAFNEKVQIIPTFGDTETVYYFGKQPVIFNLSGMLIDDVDNQWFNTFVETYGSIIRGTETARNFELIEIVLPNMIITGSIMSMSYSQDSSRDTDIPFTLQVHAKTAVPLPVRLPQALPTNALNAIDFGQAQAFRSFADVNKIRNEAVARAGKLIPADFMENSFLDPTENIRKITSFGAKLPTGLGTVTASASLFRSSIFSPVFGVLTSITKVVKDATGNISNIISSFTNPVTNILRDIQTVATQAIGIARTIEGGVNKIINGPLQVLNQLRNTIISLKRAAGVIARVPRTVAESIRVLTQFGRISTSAAFLTSGGKPGKSKVPILHSGPAYSVTTSGRLRR